MSKQTKYITSGGLAFTEQKDMARLSREAADGWLLESFAFLGYRLRKGEPQQIDYCIDYTQVSERDMPGYEEMFEAGGWKKVCSSTNYIHIFSAPKGTVPIYTDNDTYSEKYGNSIRILKPILWVPILTLALLVVLLVAPVVGEASQLMRNMLIVGVVFGTIISVPVLMTYTAYVMRLWKVRRPRS